MPDRLDELARGLLEIFPDPKRRWVRPSQSRWDCSQYIPVQRKNGDIDFVLDRSAWETHVMVERAFKVAQAPCEGEVKPA